MPALHRVRNKRVARVESESSSIPDTEPPHATVSPPEELDWEDGDDPAVQRFVSLFIHDGPPLPVVADEAAEDSDVPSVIRSRASTRVSMPNSLFVDFDV